MAGVGVDLEPVAGTEGKGLHLTRNGIFKSQDTPATEEGDPFVLPLVIPESVRRGMTERDKS